MEEASRGVEHLAWIFDGERAKLSDLDNRGGCFAPATHLGLHLIRQSAAARCRCVRVWGRKTRSLSSVLEKRSVLRGPATCPEKHLETSY